jgi:hypothetical protein
MTMMDVTFVRKMLVPVLPVLIVGGLWLAAWCQENVGPTSRANGSLENVPAIPAAAVAGDTPLHDAAVVGNAGRVARLVDAGADVNVRNSAGETPLDLAAASGSGKAVQTLLDRGADDSVLDNEGRTPLYWGARSGQPTVIAALLRHVGNQRQEPGQ